MNEVENYDFQYRDLLNLRRKAIENREKVEKEYEQDIYNLEAWEYDVESAKALLRSVKQEINQLVATNEQCKLSNAKQVRLTQLMRLRQRAIGKLKYAKTSRERIIRNIKYDKTKLQKARIIESAINQIVLWAYNEIMKYIYEFDLTCKEFHNQSESERMTQIFRMEFNSPVKLNIAVDGCNIFTCSIEAYDKKNTFRVYVKIPDLQNTYGL